MGIGKMEASWNLEELMFVLSASQPAWPHNPPLPPRRMYIINWRSSISMVLVVGGIDVRFNWLNEILLFVYPFESA